MDDSLRSIALKTFHHTRNPAREISFLHLNEPRLPITNTEHCVRDFFSDAIAPVSFPMPPAIQTYCCSQFV